MSSSFLIRLTDLFHNGRLGYSCLRRHEVCWSSSNSSSSISLYRSTRTIFVTSSYWLWRTVPFNIPQTGSVHETPGREPDTVIFIVCLTTTHPAIVISVSGLYQTHCVFCSEYPGVTIRIATKQLNGSESLRNQ